MGRRVVQVARLLVMFVGGVAILYHEVWISQNSEPILVVTGLWLTGAPIAEFLDKLRRIAALPAPESASAASDVSEELSAGTTPEWDRRDRKT